MKPKVGHHYRGHRLSYWNHLIPKLHVPGVGTTPEQHMLADHEDVNSFEGVIRESVSVSRLRTLMDSTSSSFAPANSSVSSSSSSFVAAAAPSSDSFARAGVSDSKGLPVKMSSAPATTVASVIPSPDQRRQQQQQHQPSVKSASDVKRNHSHQDATINASVSAILSERSFSTALSIVLAVGASLLILNVLIFLCMLFRRERVSSSSSSSSAAGQVAGPRDETQQLSGCQRDKGSRDQQQHQANKTLGRSDLSVNHFKGNHRSHLYPGDPSLDVVTERLTPSPVHSSSPAGFTDFPAHVSMLHSDSFFSTTHANLCLSPASALDPKLLALQECSFTHAHEPNLAM